MIPPLLTRTLTARGETFLLSDEIAESRRLRSKRQAAVLDSYPASHTQRKLQHDTTICDASGHLRPVHVESRRFGFASRNATTIPARRDVQDGNLLEDDAMRLIGENGLKLTAASTLAAVALVLIGRLIAGLLMPAPPATLGARAKAAALSPASPRKARNLNVFDPKLRSDRLELSEDTEYEGTGRNIFRLEIPVLRTPTRPKPSPPVPPKTYSPPTVRLKFFGFASTPGGTKEIFLSEDGDVFIGREGDIINRRYKILQIRPTSVEMEDLIDDVRQTLPLGQG
jgi:hypothetical protein